MPMLQAMAPMAFSPIGVRPGDHRLARRTRDPRRASTARGPRAWPATGRPREPSERSSPCRSWASPAARGCSWLSRGSPGQESRGRASAARSARRVAALSVPRRDRSQRSCSELRGGRADQRVDLLARVEVVVAGVAHGLSLDTGRRVVLDPTLRAGVSEDRPHHHEQLLRRASVGKPVLPGLDLSRTEIPQRPGRERRAAVGRLTELEAVAWREQVGVEHQRVSLKIRGGS